jgi:glycerol-3-phosphate acyltransferase PlsY
MAVLAFIVVGYLLGSVPFGVMIGKIFKGVDVRDYGSGSSGMTNVIRTVGVRAGALVMLLDMTKSVVAILLAKTFTDSQGAEVAAAVAAIVGHAWPVFAGFKGGKGISPGLSALFVLSPVSGLVTVLVGAPIIAITRYVSLGSIVGTIFASITLIALAFTGHAPPTYVWLVAIGGTIVIARHRDNIVSLVKGRERKLGQPAAEIGTEGKAGREKGLGWPRSV